MQVPPSRGRSRPPRSRDDHNPASISTGQKKNSASTTHPLFLPLSQVCALVPGEHSETGLIGTHVNTFKQETRRGKETAEHHMPPDGSPHAHLWYALEKPIWLLNQTPGTLPTSRKNRGERNMVKTKWTLQSAKPTLWEIRTRDSTSSIKLQEIKSNRDGRSTYRWKGTSET